MNKVVVFHHNDSDGLIGAYAANAYAKLGSPDAEVSFRSCNYAVKLDFSGIDKDTDVIFVDFIPDDFKESIKELAGICKNLWLIDHHSSKAEAKTIIDGWKLPNVRVDIECNVGTSGGMLAWKLMFPDIKPHQLYVVISDFDTFNMKAGKEDFYSRILPIQTGFMYLHQEKGEVNMEICETVLRFAGYGGDAEAAMDGIYDKCVEVGNILLDHDLNAWEKSALESAFEAEFEGLKAICLDTSDKGSMQFDAVYDKEKHDIMVGFQFRKDHYSLSLYSESSKIDCGEIAKKFGGGGHPGAAGASYFGDIFDIITPVRENEQIMAVSFLMSDLENGLKATSSVQETLSEACEALSLCGVVIGEHYCVIDEKLHDKEGMTKEAYRASIIRRLKVAFGDDLPDSDGFMIIKR